jgi:CO dehydrogenase/acetyl-CoA synthase delta subunit
MKIIIDDLCNFDQEGKWFELPENTEYRFKIKPITQADLRKSREKWTSIQFDKKTHQKIEVEDPKKQREVLENQLLDSVLDWEGVLEKDEKGNVVPAKFSKEKFKELLERLGGWKLYKRFNEQEGENETVTFSQWFFEIANNPENFMPDDVENL